jgi:hypothetical protein
VWGLRGASPGGGEVLPVLRGHAQGVTFRSKLRELLGAVCAAGPC